MVRNLTWRVVLVILAIVAGMFYLIPSMTDNLPSWWKDKVR